MRTLPGQKTFAPPEPTRHDRTAVTRINKSLPEEKHITPELYVRKRFEGFKWCSLGKHFVLREQFNANTREKDGLGTNCRECQARYWQGFKRRQEQKAKAPAL